MIHFGDWREVLRDVTCDAIICDPPYGERTHSSKAKRSDGCSKAGTAPTYAPFTPDLVSEFVSSWSQRCRGWMACITDHSLIDAYQSAYEANDRYSFAPVPIVIKGMSVRLAGDGPSSWGLYLMVGRPIGAPLSGALPGAYTGNRTTESGEGRGKPQWLMRAIVRDYSRRGDTIIDPFAGWGATITAAIGLRRVALGAELDKHAHDKAIRRLSNGQQQDLFDAA